MLFLFYLTIWLYNFSTYLPTILIDGHATRCTSPESSLVDIRIRTNRRAECVTGGREVRNEEGHTGVKSGVACGLYF